MHDRKFFEKQLPETHKRGRIKPEIMDNDADDDIELYDELDEGIKAEYFNEEKYDYEEWD